MIYTNRLNYEIDYEAMNEDFFCLRVTGQRPESGKSSLTPELIQKIADNCQPLSVLHQWGNSMYLLFDKAKADKAKIIENFQDSDEYQENEFSLSQIVFTSKMNENFSTHLTGYWVLQLLFNTLAHANTKKVDAEYQNLYGKLFKPVSGKRVSNRYRDVYEIKVDKPSLLNIKVRRFARFDTKKSLEEWLNYNQKSAKVFFKHNKKSGAFTRSQKPFDDLKKDGEIFVNKSNYSKTHPSVPFIDTSNIQRLQQSRVSMYLSFLSEAMTRLSKYVLKLELQQIPKRKYEHIDKPKLQIQDRVKEYYKRNGISNIQLVDLCKNSDSEKLKEILEYHSKQYNIKIDAVKKVENIINFETPTIIIIHNKEYYEKNEKKDSHCTYKNRIVQHVTIEDFLSKDEDVEMQESRTKHLVLLRDLAIKRDLFTGKADFLITEDIHNHHHFTYFILKGYINRKKTPMDIYRVKIDKDGLIVCDNYKDETEGFNLSIADEIEELLKEVKTKLEQYLSIEGWIENEKGERNYIFRTEEIILPDIKELKSQINSLDKELPKEKRHPKKASNLIQKYLSEDGARADSEKINQLVKLLEEETQMLNKKRLRKLINSVFSSQSLTFGHIRKRLYEDYKIRFIIGRGKAEKNLHEYRSGLRYWEEQNMGFYYSAEWSLSGIKTKKSNADHIRVIVPDSSKNLFFKELLPGMNEEIVNLAKRSVLPAGFKYLREYMLQLDTSQ